MTRPLPTFARRPLGAAVLTILLGTSMLPHARAGENWEEIDRRGSLVISARDRPGSSIRETRAVGTIDAPNWVIKNVLDDVEHYTSFMPYVVESRLLSRNPARHEIAVYTRMTPPLIDPRLHAARA